MTTPEKFIVNAIKASLFVNPDEYGLTLEELTELGARHDVRRGELEDALRFQRAHVDSGSDGRYRLSGAYMMDLAMFLGTLNGDPRNVDAFDFVWKTFHELNREFGDTKGRISRPALINQGTQAGIKEQDLQVAIGIYVAFGRMQQDGDVLHSFGTSGGESPKSESARARISINMNAGVTELLGEVRDIIFRRTDGRAAFAEPIPAFGSVLDDLRVSGLKAWWNGVSAEYRRSDEQVSPTTVIVLGAALVEAALCAVIARVNVVGGTMPNLSSQSDPKNWKLQTLVKEAKKGNEPIFDGGLGDRAERLNDLRQRIHAGRFWMPGAPANGFDLRPEEAREARETVDRALRAVLNWVQAHPEP